MFFVSGRVKIATCPAGSGKVIRSYEETLFRGLTGPPS